MGIVNISETVKEFNKILKLLGLSIKCIHNERDYLGTLGVDKVDGLHDVCCHRGHEVPGGGQRGPGRGSHHHQDPDHGLNISAAKRAVKGKFCRIN